MIHKTVKTAIVALVCTFGLTLGANALAQHEGAPTPSTPAAHDLAKPGEHGATHEGGGHGAGHDHAPPAPMNIADFGNKTTPPYVALLVNFGLLAFMYYSLGKKPVAEALKQRKEDIGKEIEEAQQLLADAISRGKGARKKLKTIDADKQSAREAQEKAERMGRDASFLVDQETKQLRLDLTKETVEKAVAQAEGLLKGAVTQADHERLAEEFLAELASKVDKRADVAVKAGGAA